MINPMDLSEHTILVTGASSGIGRATCVLLSELGAKVILTARRQEQLEETLSLMSHDGHTIVPFDLSQVEQIPAWLKDVADQHGKLNGLVHCAGMQLMKPIRDFDDESVQGMMALNFNAAFSLIRGFRHKQVYSRDSSSIVLLSSIAGLVGTPGNSIYSATKGAIIALVRSAALEVARQGIRVNGIAPGFIDTEMGEGLKQTLSESQFNKLIDQHPLGLGMPEDVANAIAFLLANSGRWITGTTLVVDGGYTAQ